MKQHTAKTTVPPQELIVQDMRQMASLHLLRTTWPVEELIFMQSIEGHAHEGHGCFGGKRYPDTTIDLIAGALRKYPFAVQEARQHLIDQVKGYMEAALEGRDGSRLLCPDGSSLFGIGWLRDLEVNPRDLLRGFYLGTVRDQPEIRKKLEETLQIKIGTGDCYPVNTSVMDSLGLDGYDLATGSHEQKLEEYRKRGLIVEVRSRDAAGKEIEYLYIRHRKGPGSSDDAAIAGAGMLYNRDAALGAFLADAVDTIEKYTPYFADQDEEIAALIKNGAPWLSLTEKEILRYTYVCIIPEQEEEWIPDSSLRHLLQVDRKVDQSPLESHLLYAQKKPFAHQTISSTHASNEKFYRYLEKRMAEAEKLF